METLPQSPFLRLPLEIRLTIYEYLLLPSAIPSSNHSSSVTNLLPDYHTYYSADTNSDPYTLTVRTIDPYLGAHSSRSWRRRSTYHVRTGPFLTSSTPTTYRILLSPYTSHLRHTIPSLLPLCRQIHAEAARVLYSTYTISLAANVEAGIPFLQDLTPVARASIRRLQITKKAGPYTKEFDRAEWGALCAYLARQSAWGRGEQEEEGMGMGMALRTLHLGVIAGKPGEDGWDGVQPITQREFEVLGGLQRWAGQSAGVELEWVEQVMQIKGLREVCVSAFVEPCPVPRSERMRFWVQFSASVEAGLDGEVV
ncbi:hypothetical protein K491DRAFT_142348 [Lophiostoma macrostomum CBS 122681]|uniref:Uncharacterized protein n=1 Tax=Lophiostoma macrostomum CBS 122681 TaxID=1314788 RepID=A0A6A6ST80_9PLEO|nr:hypothetical protein K491DRAFT_142348 [Lophiostoma macrostomum CBS 122681]